MLALKFSAPCFFPYRLSVNGKFLRHLLLNNSPKIDNEFVTEIFHRASEVNTALEHVEFSGCGVVSPLSSDFLDILSDKLAGLSPLVYVAFSCHKLDPVDVDSLRQIWTDHWKEEAVCECSGDFAKLTLKHLIAQNESSGNR